MKRYLVTGGAGFIGSNFIKYIMQKQDVVVLNIDNLEYSGNLENLKEVENNSRYRFIHGDICDKELVEGLFKREEFDYIVHFAAMTHVDRSIENVEPFIKVNISGTYNLLENARKAWFNEKGYMEEKRFLYVSTDEVYGDLGEGEYFTETTLIAPRNPYSASKAGAELMVRAYSETYKLPINITRCSNNYGPNQFPEKLIPLLVNNCINKKPLPIYGDGKSVRDWIFVKDHCTAIEIILEKGKVGEVYNIGGHNEKTTLDIAYMVVDYINKKYDKKVTRKLITYVADRKGHDRRYAISPAKMIKELNWFPSITFEEGIKLTIDWYMNHQEWLENIVNGEYKEYYKRRYGN